MNILFSTLRFKNWDYISNFHTPSSCFEKVSRLGKVSLKRDNTVLSRPFTPRLLGLLGTGSSAVKTGKVPCQLIN